VGQGKAMLGRNGLVWLDEAGMVCSDVVRCGDARSGGEWKGAFKAGKAKFVMVRRGAVGQYSANLKATATGGFTRSQ